MTHLTEEKGRAEKIVTKLTQALGEYKEKNDELETVILDLKSSIALLEKERDKVVADQEETTKFANGVVLAFRCGWLSFGF